jgi:hypothetical protein
MRSTTILAALIAVVFAAASAASVFAQSSAPGTTPPRPNKVTAVPPPPPPPGGPDKLTTQTGPKAPGSRIAKPREHTVIDDFAPDPNTLPSTCYAAIGIAYGNCVASLVTLCVKHSGTFSCTDDSCTCKYPEHN